MDRLQKKFAFVDGKFYTIFSILFGIGFSLILARRSVSLFLRRMLILACIGFCHLMFIWSGDILLLYAVGGHFSAEREGLTASIPTLLTAGALAKEITRE